VPAGKSTVLIGPSASGKSVLIRCILGLMEHDAGEIRIGGGAVAASRRIRVLF